MTFRFAAAILFGPMLFAQTSPLTGRWDFNTPAGASWLGISEKDIWFQPTSGNVYRVTDYKAAGPHLILNLPKTSAAHPAMTWTLDAAPGKLTGTQDVDGNKTPLLGVPAPDLKRNAPKAWTDPQPLFNGKDLTGWEPIGDPANSHWIVQNGVLVNEQHGANLKTTRAFDDFKLHFETNCPEGANSGFYLRGRYELQLAYEPAKNEPPERRMGAIYGRIAPVTDLPRTPGQWESFDVILIGRAVTVVHNGVTIINGRQIEGITGGALDANEGKPGRFYIQGDHTGGLKFRNLTVSEPSAN